jgi:ATP-dependent Lhr-like helicase
VELAARVARHAKESGQLDVWLTTLQSDRRILEIRVAAEVRYAAAEDAGRFRDALGTVLPPGLPTAFLQSPEDPLLDLVSRYARTHLPFTTIEVAQRWGQSSAAIQLALEKLASRGRVLEGEFLPGRRGREWTDPNVLRLLKRRSLAQLRKQVEPVEQAALARFLPVWQGIKEPRRGLDGLLDVVEQLQGLPLPASVWEDSVLPQRIAGYSPANLDELCAAGEVAWRGIESLGSDDGRIALYLADHVPLLSPAPQPLGADEEPVTCAVLECLTQRGAMFFDEIARHLGGFRNDVLDSLWRLVWAGHVTNDTLAPLRARRKPRKGSTRAATSRSRRNRFRSRRTDILPGSEGRWSLLFPLGTQLPDATTQQVAIATQLISRYGVLTREMIALEGLRGGFAAVYPVLKAMEEAGKVRRGYFVAGLGAAQFAAPGAEDQLRHPRRSESGDDSTRGIVMAATDPANPYGAALPWPVSTGDEQARPQRAAGARVILVDGQLTGYIGRTGQTLQTFLPEDQADCAAYRTVLAKTLAHAAQLDPILLNKVDGKRPAESELHEALHLAGFIQLSRGMLCRPKS